MRTTTRRTPRSLIALGALAASSVLLVACGGWWCAWDSSRRRVRIILSRHPTVRSEIARSSPGPIRGSPADVRARTIG